MVTSTTTEQANRVEQEMARSAIRARCSSSAGPKLQQLLNDVSPVGVIGIDAGTRQHIDADNHGGGFFTNTKGSARGNCCSRCPSTRSTSEPSSANVLYINTPRVLHGACVPPDAATAERVGRTWETNKFSAARKEHLTYGV